MTGLPAAGVHGGDGAAVAAALGLPVADVLDLSATLNPLAPDPGPALAARLDAVRRYPDDAAATAALARAMGVDPSRLLLTNGGAEAIALVAAELGGTVGPGEFALYGRHLGAGAVGPAVPGAWRWRSNPHSPLGGFAPDRRDDEPPTVWDEAFWPLAAGTWTRGDADRGDVVLGSLTKLLACPGLRAGYVLAGDEDLLARLRARRPRWSVNGLVCAALGDLLAPVDLPAWAERLGVLRSRLVAVVEGHGLTARPGRAPWVLVEGCPDLRRRLAAEAVVVRDCTSFGLPGLHRIAVCADADLDRLDAALDRALGSQP